MQYADMIAMLLDKTETNAGGCLATCPKCGTPGAIITEDDEGEGHVECHKGCFEQDVLSALGSMPKETELQWLAGASWFNGRVVANAKLECVRVHENPDGTHVMEVAITRGDGGGEYTCMVPAEALEDQRKINVIGTTVARANFQFKEKDGSLRALKVMLQGQPGNNNVVVDVSQTGWNDKYNCWFGSSGVIDSRGAFHPWSSRGVTCSTRRAGRYVRRTFNMRAERFGSDMPTLDPPAGPAAQPLHELKGERLFFTDAAAMPVEVQPTERPIDVAWDAWAVSSARAEFQPLAALWWRNTGNYAGAIAMGYMAACAVRHSLVVKERNFPHLYISGRWGNGKDTLADVLATACGLNPSSVVSAGKTTTDKLIRNKLSQCGDVPLWVNELRADNSDTLLTQVRTSYDLQGNGVTNIKQEQVMFPVHRPFLLVGEVQVGRDAEFSRYVSLKLSKRPADKSVINSLKSTASRFSPHWTNILRDHNRAGWQIALAVDILKPIFLESGCDSRRARNWAITTAGLAYLFDADCHLDPRNSIPVEIFDEIMERAADAMTASMDEGQGQLFWGTIQSMRADGELSNNGSARWARFLSLRETKGIPAIGIWTPHLFRLALKADRNFNRGLVLNELKSDPGFIGHRSVRLGGEPRDALLFDERSTRLPRWVVALAHEENKDANDDVEDNLEPRQLDLPAEDKPERY